MAVWRKGQLLMPPSSSRPARPTALASSVVLLPVGTLSDCTDNTLNTVPELSGTVPAALWLSSNHELETDHSQPRRPLDYELFFQGRSGKAKAGRPSSPTGGVWDRSGAEDSPAFFSFQPSIPEAGTDPSFSLASCRPNFFSPTMDTHKCRSMPVLLQFLLCSPVHGDQPVTPPQERRKGGGGVPPKDWTDESPAETIELVGRWVNAKQELNQDDGKHVPVVLRCVELSSSSRKNQVDEADSSPRSDDRCWPDRIKVLGPIRGRTRINGFVDKLISITGLVHVLLSAGDAARSRAESGHLQP
ncbi:hypothetical protein CDD83_9116 [Cordyceps sp. RAO-2017]|nr:hypothetical protein CDD83_9116 [Cordyceps sp. RAO-2017]